MAAIGTRARGLGTTDRRIACSRYAAQSFLPLPCHGFRSVQTLRHPDSAPGTTLLATALCLRVLLLSGAGYLYYRQALALLVQREYDLSVLLAGMSWVGLLAGVTLAEVGGGPVVGWLTWTLLLASMSLTAGWFLARGYALWLSLRPEAGMGQIGWVSRNSTGG